MKLVVQKHNLEIVTEAYGIFKKQMPSEVTGMMLFPEGDKGNYMLDLGEPRPTIDIFFEILRGLKPKYKARMGIS